ncbi:EAL domain-containing protein [Paenibacillus spongiae]|uniref:EAL domain-containing protein n=1 Tax=Paenibacillus spongiae TaxID=2909671 RepID=A0ABY5S7G5_9BACL|nr:EAL domain-containing protein [Paenibacillus spongiae]UVI28485.1 EAL domain-containing protein [Paenibacillus spongiae]
MRGRYSVRKYSKRSGQVGPTGIIYVAWHGRGKEREDVKSAIDAHWRHFVQEAIAKQRNAGVGHLRSVWMKDDLYICLQLPYEGAEVLEEQLLELGSRFKDDWERRFMQTALGGWIEELRLHTGISIVERLLPGRYDELWYEGIKRAIIHGQSPSAPERSMRIKAFNHLIQSRLIYPVYQPIISLRNETVYGYEALLRCPDNRWFAGPQPLFAFAAEEGMLYTLDRLARERAIEESTGLADGQKLFINITSQIIDDPSFTPGQTRSLLEQFGLSPHHVVFELTERSSIEDFGAAKKILDHYRNQGYQIAIDDAGAGYSSLQSIVELQPDLIKIDRSLIRGIHLDPMKEHIVQHFTELAAKMGISIVAEGIEEEEELAQIRSMGIAYAQGYLLGKPQASIGRNDSTSA